MDTHLYHNTANNVRFSICGHYLMTRAGTVAIFCNRLQIFTTGCNRSDGCRSIYCVYMHINPREHLQTQQGGQVRIEQALALSSLSIQSNAGSLSVINSGISCLHPFYNRQNIVITVEGCKIFQPVGRGCDSNRLKPSNRASPNSHANKKLYTENHDFFH